MPNVKKRNPSLYLIILEVGLMVYLRIVNPVGRNGTKLRNREYVKKNAAKTREYLRMWQKEHPDEVGFYNLKMKASAREIEFNISLEFYKELQKTSHCPVCEVAFTCGRGKGTNIVLPSHRSVDRLDSNLGYAPGNVWVICHRCNTIKNNASLSDLKRLVRVLEERLSP